MRILLVGAGGVGGAFAAIAARRGFFEKLVIADYDDQKADRAAAADERYVGVRIDASDARAVTDLCREHAITHVMNAVDPVFNMSLFDGALAAGADYLDMAMSLSKPHPEDRKSTRLNSSHLVISYAVFCLKKKKIKINYNNVQLHD